MIDTRFRPRLAEIAPRYRGFIIDQWGVLHDGGDPYPDAIDCLRALRALDKRIVLLSNSGKRAEENGRRLAEMGFEHHLFDAIVTSGEATWQALRDRTDPAFAGLGERCYLWSRDHDRSHVDGLPLEVVEDAGDADFLLLAGIEDHAELAPFLPILEIGARRGLKMVCANPDIVAIYPHDRRGMAPGGVARHYESLGGEVIYVGKPHRPVYELCLKKLGGLPLDGILGIGDSVEHDIAGGSGVGIDTALLTQGVHSDAFAGADDPDRRAMAVARLTEAHGATPRWLLPRFVW